MFSILNIPFPSSTTLKKYERAVGIVIEDIAKESCKDAAVTEKTGYGKLCPLLNYKGALLLSCLS